jgi:hypothetical protein
VMRVSGWSLVPLPPARITPFKIRGCYRGMPDERPIQDDPVVLEGEDELPRQPAPPLDPYTPEPGPGPGERRPFLVLSATVIVLTVVLALVIWAAVR